MDQLTLPMMEIMTLAGIEKADVAKLEQFLNGIYVAWGSQVNALNTEITKLKKL